MQTSHKLTRILVALCALVVLAAAAMAQANPTDISGSDQKAGSVLVYPYYSSNSQTKADTRMVLSNLSSTETVPVHLFFFDKGCSQADTFVCLTPNASVVIKASEFDPDQTGWVLATTASNRTGYPYEANSLIGNAFVQDGDYVGNYGAEAFGIYTRTAPPVQGFISDIRTMDGGVTVGFNILAPYALAIELQSPADAVGQRIVTVGLTGNITAGTTVGAGQRGTGIIYNGNEKPFGSFSPFLPPGCRSEAIIDVKTPRVPGGLVNMIPAGHVATMRINVGAVDGSGTVIGGAVGLLMTPKSLGNKWYGIRGLHQTAQASSRLTIPVFLPMCN